MVGWVALDRPEPGHWRETSMFFRLSGALHNIFVGAICAGTSRERDRQRGARRQNTRSSFGDKGQSKSSGREAPGSARCAAASFATPPLMDQRARSTRAWAIILEFLRLFFFLQFDLYTFSSFYPARSRRIFSGQHSASTLPCISIPPFMATPRHRTKFFGTQTGWTSVRNGPDAHEGHLHPIR
ncbi:hypothetical protein C8R47DRAFT_1085434 [Mycena vitilis]|nr:hypothetical protein C8R47DRAFT_1085434 [Mycena vitilis]